MPVSGNRLETTMSTSCFTRRRWLAGTAAIALAACAPVRAPTQAPTDVPVRPGRLRLIGEATLAHRLLFKGTTVGGLSGLDFDPASPACGTRCAMTAPTSRPRAFTRCACRWTASAWARLSWWMP
jgi:hypothetical protein